MGSVWRFDKSNLIGFVIRKDKGSHKSLFSSYQMGLSDGAFFMIKLPHCPMEITPFRAPFAQWK